MLRENTLPVRKQLLVGGETEVQIRLCLLPPLSLTNLTPGGDSRSQRFFSPVCLTVSFILTMSSPGPTRLTTPFYRRAA